MIDFYAFSDELQKIAALGSHFLRGAAKFKPGVATRATRPGTMHRQMENLSRVRKGVGASRVSGDISKATQRPTAFRAPFGKAQTVRNPLYA